MEPGVIPSFKFPSRHNNVNYAIGLTNRAQRDETVMVRPAKNTDINLESALENTLIQPPLVDKYILDYKGVVPASANLYVQPGRAEGVTELAKLMNAENKVTEITSANNALRRGNRVAAEFLLGRELTTEEMSNSTLTPEIRQGENGEARHMPLNNNSIGSLVAADGRNHHNRLEMLKQVEKGVINEMAAHLGVPVMYMKHLKTIMGFTGDSVLGWKAFTPVEKEVIYKQFKKELTKLQNEPNSAAAPPVSILDGQNRPIHSGVEAEMEANAYRRQLQLINGMNNDAINEDGVVPGLNHANQDEFRGRSDTVNQQLRERRAGGPPDANSGAYVLNPQAVSIAQDFVPSDQAALAIELDREPGRPRELQVPNIPDRLAQSVRPAEPTLQIQLAHDAEYKTYTNDSRGQRQGESQQRSDSAIPPYVNVEAAAAFDPTERGIVVANNRRYHADTWAREAHHLPGAIIHYRTNPKDKEHALNNSYASSWYQFKRHYADELKEDDDQEINGGGLYARPRRTFKRKRISETSGGGLPDRWVPQTDSIAPRGGVASGQLMRATGQNAVPISAQIQVANQHQFDETPLREWIKNPNSTQVIKTYHSDMPVPQNDDRPGRRSKKVKFGGYMLDHNKLLGSSVLSISHPSGRKVKGFPNQEVSPGMKAAIHNIVTGGDVNTKRLRADEKLKLHSMLSKSAAKTGADINVSPSEQLKLAMGEMEAGNDSPALKAQIKRLLPILRRSNLITAGQVSDISQHYL